MRYAFVFALISLSAACVLGQVTVEDCYVPVEKTCVEVAAVGLQCTHGATHTCSLDVMSQQYKCMPDKGMEQTTENTRSVRIKALPQQSGYTTWTENAVHICGIMHSCSCNLTFSGCVSINSNEWGPMTYVPQQGDTNCVGQ
jgi:hypothetical protein